MAQRLTGKKLLAQLENQIRGRGVHLAYEKLQFAGLKLNSGLCWFKGRYYLFVDRYKKVGERVDLIKAALEELDHLALQGRLDNPEAAPQPDPEQPSPQQPDQDNGPA